MRADPQTDVLNAAIASCAVLLNRVQWLDPTRLDVQRGVWYRQLVKARHFTDVVLSVADFEEATLLIIDRVGHQAALPAEIVADAVTLAKRRADRVNDLVARHNADPDGCLIATELAEFDRSEGDERYIVHQFRNAVTKLCADLAASNFPDEVTDPICAHMEREAEAAIEARARRG